MKNIFRRKNNAAGTGADLGIRGEDIARRYLISIGWRVAARRWRLRGGEIDLVAYDGGEIVFVEVKTRASAEFGEPEESVTAAKRSRLRRAAWSYLSANGLTDREYRIDVLAVSKRPDGSVVIRHIRSAVGED